MHTTLDLPVSDTAHANFARYTEMFNHVDKHNREAMQRLMKKTAARQRGMADGRESGEHPIPRKEIRGFYLTPFALLTANGYLTVDNERLYVTDLGLDILPLLLADFPVSQHAVDTITALLQHR